MSLEEEFATQLDDSQRDSGIAKPFFCRWMISAGSNFAAARFSNALLVRPFNFTFAGRENVP